MTTIKPETRSVSLPKNRTGIFAADTIHEVRPTRNHFIKIPTLSPQFRNNGSTKLLLASSEQNHHQLQQYYLSKNETQQYYPIDKNAATPADSSNDSRLTSGGVRNGFRPSAVRHQKLRLTTAIAQRDAKSSKINDSKPKSAFIQSQASAKLRSEIDHINNKLKRHGESNKSLYVQNFQELDGTPQSALSYSTSCRLSSATTNMTADRIHQRFSSAITHGTGSIHNAIVETNNNNENHNNKITSDQTIQLLSSIATLPQASVQETEDNQQNTNDYQLTYAYQIPQQANVGSESIFFPEPPSSASIKTRPIKNDRRQNDAKSVACPFYVMYLTNLTMQQQQQQTPKDETHSNENATPPLGMASTMRKVPVNSRTSTANAKRQAIRRQVTSPISINTYSTLEDDDCVADSMTLFNNKRLSARILSSENENSSMLRDILRTSSLNHIQV